MRGMGNMQGMMNKMKKMQKEMEKTQKKLDEKEFIGSANNDLVTVTFTGNQQLKDVTIAKEIIDPDDKEIIEDLVLLAINDALEQIEKETDDKMGQYTNNLNIPGF